MFNPKYFKDITVNGVYLYRKGHSKRERLRKSDFVYELKLIKDRHTGRIDYDPIPYFDFIDRIFILFTGSPS